MEYNELSLLQKSNKYTFLKGVSGGLAETCVVLSNTIESAKQFAKTYKINYDFVLETKLIRM